MFDFPHSLVINSFLLHLVCTVALSQRGVAITWRERVKNPYVKKCYTPYKIIACIERATVLRANITRVTREYKAGEGALSYSRLTN